MKARVLAFYLPQFHPCADNDRWWGKGFTEWTNVTKAKSLYWGHQQPVYPSDLGYYDLRVPEVREAQAQMAREAGIEGFLYWHYWFGNGRRILERPFNEVLASGRPDFPFALAWANESWKGRWHGLMEGQWLVKQEYPGDDDFVEHFKFALPAFKDPRYITVDGKPMFVVYHPDEFPAVKRFIELWRRLALQNGLKGLCFVGISQVKQKDCAASRQAIIDMGFDFVNWQGQEHSHKPTWMRWARSVLSRRMHIMPELWPYTTTLTQSELDREEDCIPTCYSGWDNTPRAGVKGRVLVGFNPEAFELNLAGLVERIMHKPPEHRFLFIKSWNEWAEGNYLEPDRRWGHGLLAAIKRVLVEK